MISPVSNPNRNPPVIQHNSVGYSRMDSNHCTKAGEYRAPCVHSEIPRKFVHPSGWLHSLKILIFNCVERWCRILSTLYKMKNDDKERERSDRIYNGRTFWEFESNIGKNVINVGL